MPAHQLLPSNAPPFPSTSSSTPPVPVARPASVIRVGCSRRKTAAKMATTIGRAATRSAVTEAVTNSCAAVKVIPGITMLTRLSGIDCRQRLVLPDSHPRCAAMGNHIAAAAVNDAAVTVQGSNCCNAKPVRTLCMPRAAAKSKITAVMR